MTIKIFKGIGNQQKLEYNQLKEIVTLLNSHYNNELIYILTNFFLNNIEIDCLLLRNNGPIILELKSYCGKINGNENQKNWEVTTNKGEILPLTSNLFKQLRIQREDVIDRLNKIYSGYIPRIDRRYVRNIAAWGYFEKGSIYVGQIDLRKTKWFNIITSETLLETLDHEYSSYTLFPDDYSIIVRELGLEEYPLPNVAINNSVNDQEKDNDEFLSEFGKIWEKIKDYQEKVFISINRKSFSYTIKEDTLIINGNNTSFFLKNEFLKAYEYGPCKGPAFYPENMKQSGYIWAIIHDKRITNFNMNRIFS